MFELRGSELVPEHRIVSQLGTRARSFAQAVLFRSVAWLSNSVKNACAPLRTNALRSSRERLQPLNRARALFDRTGSLLLGRSLRRWKSAHFLHSVEKAPAPEAPWPVLPARSFGTKEAASLNAPKRNDG